MDGLNKLQARIDIRFYVTALSFATDLCEVITNGINTPPKEKEPSEPRFEVIDPVPVKNIFADIRERRRLARRILRAIQPYLDTALHVESEILQKPFESVQKELENMVESSVDPARPPTATSRDKRSEEPAVDTIMVDAPDTLQITVRSELEDGATDGEAMDTAEDGDDGGNIEVNTSGLEVDGENDEAASGSILKSTDTPPDLDGYTSKPHPAQSGPPTPPQSNGSLGQEPSDPLTEGGLVWYMKAFNPEGTTVVDEHWAAGRDAVRMLSEDLTDLDDEELKGLGVDVDSAMKTVAMEVDEDVEVAASAAKSKATKSRKRRTSSRRR